MARIYSGLRGADGDTVSTVTDPHYNHLVVAVSYFTDNTFTTPATPTTGTISIQGRINGNLGWSDLADSPIDCTDIASSASTSIPVEEIRAVCSGLDSGVYFQVTITANSH